MAFEFTSPEAQPIARAIIRHYKRQQARVKVERAAWSDAPYRTTVTVSRGRLMTLIEAQERLSYGTGLGDLARWLAARRHYAELYVAVGSDTELQMRALEDMKHDGIGILLVDDGGRVSIIALARNPALLVTPEPTLTYGSCASEVTRALAKFNEVNRKDGLRDMCELVERLTNELGVKPPAKHGSRHPRANSAATGQVRSTSWRARMSTPLVGSPSLLPP